MPREHRDHVGDDEGCRRPGHQEEGDEGHSPEEAQHRGERALRSTSGPRSRLAAGCLEAVATTQTAKARRRRDGGGSETARTGPAPEGGKRSEVRGRRVDRQPGGWGASERSRLVAKPVKSQSGSPVPRSQSARPPPRPRQATPDSSASFRFCLGRGRVGAAGDAGFRGDGQLLRKSAGLAGFPAPPPLGVSL